MSAFVDLIIGSIMKYLLQYLGTYIPEAIHEWERKRKRDADQRAAKAKLDEINSKVDSTVEERAKAYEDYINSGRN
jgi:hypothetical protein